MVKVHLILIILLAACFNARSQNTGKYMDTTQVEATHDTIVRMKIDIWSDIMCPFCYIGKRQLEEALREFPGRDEVELVWHSYQLDPDLKTQPGKDLYGYLAERKGQTREWSVRMHQHVMQQAKQVGLTYNFDNAVVANSFHAHRLIHLAQKHHLGNEAEERLFKAYFTDGEDIGNFTTLLRLGIEIGLDSEEVTRMLSGNEFAAQVRNDGREAADLGAKGVPFFVVNQRYAISGAQGSKVFLEMLENSFDEWKKDKLFSSPTRTGGVCEPGKECN